MQVRVLGCSGAIAKNCRTTSFLVDSDLLVDAGTGVGDLTLEEMAAIDDVVLTHSHLDHIAALPLMLDAVASRREKPLRVHALRATIEALRAYVFNNVIWPDFASIPSREAPFVSFHDIAIGQQLQLGTRDLKQVEVLPAVHTVPACGFAVRPAQGGPNWVFSGDTERNAPFWDRVNELDVAMLVIETAFSNREQALAERALHLSPATLADELNRIAPGKSYPIYITHTKPAETEEIMSQIDAFATGWEMQGQQARDIRWLQADGVLFI
ncbi:MULTISPECIES: 3',5'-cyclic-nucleotide phosphodiesterase [unclassified Variovorax]|uniref:3',5'-cyclic-nucleotide phosphodiesterase n=1 Tax=unclassified Variovorax TaxID=663243 RepID=UPI0013197114|nr:MULTISPECIES: 3',5'-cyclic-nucleotide phosphodiesterase [unclassified Variovorax]VTU34051.1 ribonuclease Z [Variovorax sp. SRS16]VTU40126.1 ribonuclease Z [Variovorax sp. PBL-E5]